jgi:hypothetical protein
MVAAGNIARRGTVPPFEQTTNHLALGPFGVSVGTPCVFTFINQVISNRRTLEP